MGKDISANFVQFLVEKGSVLFRDVGFYVLEITDQNENIFQSVSVIIDVRITRN